MPFRVDDRSGQPGAVLQPVEPVEHGKRFVARRAPRHRGAEQPTSLAAVAAMKRGDAVLKQLFGLALALS